MTKKKLNVCLACSAGGHLTEMLQVRGCYKKYPHFFITFNREDTVCLKKSENVYFVNDTSRSFLDFIKCNVQTFRILWKERPDVIISTGAGVAIPACYLGKLLFGAKIVFIESICRIEKPSFSGRLAYFVADKFFVQWKEMLKQYGKKTIYRGAVV